MRVSQATAMAVLVAALAASALLALRAQEHRAAPPPPPSVLPATAIDKPKGPLPLNPGIKRTTQPRSKNVRLVGWIDMNGRPDAEEVGGWGNYLYVAHWWSRGTSVIDISNPAAPKVVSFIPNDVPGAWNPKLQVYGNILVRLVHHNIFANPPTRGEWTGVEVFDVSDPAHPKKLSDIKTSTGGYPERGTGTHKFWFNDGRYLHLAAGVNGYKGNIYVIYDLIDPSHPKEVSRWWWPGQGPGEQYEPAYEGMGAHAAQTNRKGNLGFYSVLHDPGGLNILDLSDITRLKLLSRLDLSPPFEPGYFGGHNIVPLDSRDMIVLVDEEMEYSCKGARQDTWIVDIKDPRKPTVLSTYPFPGDQDHDCTKPVRYGPHNMHENRAGSLIDDWMTYGTYYNGGLRVYDISNPKFPREVGFYEPADPKVRMDERPFSPERNMGSDLMTIGHVWVDTNGLMYATGYQDGLFVLEYTGPRPEGSRTALEASKLSLNRR